MPVPTNAPPGKSSTANRLHSSSNCLCSVIVAELYNIGNSVGMGVVGHITTPTPSKHGYKLLI